MANDKRLDLGRGIYHLIVADLDELQRHLDAIHPGIPLDDVDAVTYVRLMVVIKQIFTKPGMLDAVHNYVASRRAEDGE